MQSTTTCTHQNHYDFCSLRNQTCSLESSLDPFHQSKPQQESQDSSQNQDQKVTLKSQRQSEIEAALGKSSLQRPLSLGTGSLRTVMTYYTTNGWNLDTTNARTLSPTMGWNGIFRMYLSPYNVGYDLLEQYQISSYQIDWIRIKVLSITFSKAVNQRNISGPVNVNNLTNMNADQIYYPYLKTSADGFVGFDGTTYTIGYFTAQQLASLQDSQTIGSAFTVTKQTNGEYTRYLYGNGVNTEGVPGSSIESIASYQYQGTYACEAQETQTLPLGESCEFLIQNPHSLSLSLTSTLPVGPNTGDGTATNTYLYGTNQYGINTKTALMNLESFQYTNQQQPSTPIQTTNAQSPIFGMIQIDLPEDLIQTVYKKNGLSYQFGISNNGTVGDATADFDPLTTDVMRTELQDEELFLLNANFQLLVEYGIRSTI